MPILTNRRSLLAFAGLMIASPALATAPPGGRLRFAVWRNGERIGDHEMTFVTGGGLTTVSCEAAMKFKIGPIGVTYSHTAKELWKGDDFQSVETASLTNGKRESVSARRTAAGVVIQAGSTSKTVAAETAPLSHWNSAVLNGPLFNPQNGKLLKVTASRGAPVLPADSPLPSGARWSLRGGADIDDWYDANGVWSALRGRLPDRSIMEYRRV